MVPEDLRNNDSCSGSSSVDAAACTGFFGVSLFGNSPLGAGLRGGRWVAGGEVDKGEIDEDAAASFAADRLPFFFVHRHKMNNNNMISWRWNSRGTWKESKNVTQTRRSQLMMLLIRHALRHQNFKS